MSPSGFGERMVTLCDGRPGLRSGLHVQVAEPTKHPSSVAELRRVERVDESRSTHQAPERQLPDHVADRDAQHLGAPQRSDGGSTPDSQPILDFIASDETLDRGAEIISAEGWRLESYLRNPVFQNAHQYGDIIFTLGRALITEVRVQPSSTLKTRPSAYLFQRIQFATEANPMARIAYALYKGKFLNAVSVGFIPQRWEDGSPSSASSPSFRRRYLEQELLEVSAVGIPANPNALQLGLKAGAIQKSDLQELLDLLRSLCSSKLLSPSLLPSPQGGGEQLSTFNSLARLSGATAAEPILRSHPAVPNTHAGASGVRSNEAQWLRLAREVRELMRKT